MRYRTIGVIVGTLSLGAILYWFGAHPHRPLVATCLAYIAGAASQLISSWNEA